MARVRWEPFGFRWDPFRETFELRNTINHLFDEAFRRSSGISGTRYPRVDLIEKDQEVLLNAELPGVKSDEVNISFHQGTLTLSGERKTPDVPAGGACVRGERTFGTFQRMFEIPVPVDEGQITATFRDGILTVSLPKREEAKPKEISVTVE